MSRISFVLVVVCSFFSHAIWAQIRVSKLVVEKGQQYQLQGSDILVADTLILRDSSSLILNSRRKDNFIHTKLMVVGNHCFIHGEGKSAGNEKEASPAFQVSGPCSNGAVGKNGAIGKNGTDGINLALYAGAIQINGSLTFLLNGGNGGDGGQGGRGGDGGSGTRVCTGGDGGKGGNGGKGGSGGKGGNLLMDCKQCPDLHLWEEIKLIIKNYGGYAGLGGDGGYGGQAGLGPSKDGKNGAKGSAGTDGEEGKTGAITFVRY